MIEEKKDSMAPKDVILGAEMVVGENEFAYTSSIEAATEQANAELAALQETVDSVKNLKPQCDKIDYALAAGSGALCGIVDIFLVGAPGESPLGDITDQWFANRTKGFARMCGWKKDGDVKSAMRFLEKKFDVPYDQRGCGDAASKVFDGLTPSNHHFKSLAHNPSLMGLFFSILDQFTNASHFVDDGDLIELVNDEGTFELRGNNIPSKLFCAFVNWIGHLISDVSGSSSSSGRGKGIPSPLWTWMNDITVIKRKLGIEASEFDKTFNEFASQLFEQGYDFRFQTAQAIPVLLNELIVRMFYMIRRLVGYLGSTSREERNFSALWDACKPFSNPTVRRMLTVAHGTFCLLDVGDATVRAFAKGGGTFNPVEFVLRLNVIGVGRFAISLYGEAKDGVRYWRAKKKADFAEREMAIVEDYIEGLKLLAAKYDDAGIMIFIEQLGSEEHMKEAFEKSIELADLRGVPHPLRTLEDIDIYFNPTKQ